jgi:hypothetical protein
MLGGGKIKKEDLAMLVVTDSADEAVRTMVDCYEASCARAEQKSEAARLPGGGMRRDRAERARVVK